MPSSLNAQSRFVFKQNLLTTRTEELSHLLWILLQSLLNSFHVFLCCCVSTPLVRTLVFFVCVFFPPPLTVLGCTRCSLFTRGFGTVIWDKVALKLNSLPACFPPHPLPPHVSCQVWSKPSPDLGMLTQIPRWTLHYFDSILRWPGPPFQDVMRLTREMICGLLCPLHCSQAAVRPRGCLPAPGSWSRWKVSAATFKRRIS